MQKKNQNSVGIKLIDNESKLQVRALQTECLEVANKYFELLELGIRWDNYQEQVENNLSDRGQNHDYYGKTKDQITFRQNECIAIFCSQSDKPFDYSSEKYPGIYYDAKKYALASICLNYILTIAQRINTVKSDKTNAFNLHLDSFMDICNFFSEVFERNKKYSNPNEIIWRLWQTYWSNPQHPSSCYSQCPGVCGQSCQGTNCYYFFPAAEKLYSELPDNEKADPRNIFDDNLFWLAQQFQKYVIKKSF